jgi:hypothetical protein
MIRANFIIPALIICFAANDGFAQGSRKKFSELSCAEKRWVIFHPFIAGRAAKLTSKAISKTREISATLDNDSAGGQVDAFRHAYWMALLTRHIRWRKAESLGKAHEKGNYRQFLQFQKDEEYTSPDSISGEMDLFNNRIGLTLGCNTRNLPEDSLASIIVTAIKAGRMRVIRKDNSGRLLDCEGKIIDISMYHGRWNIPKCLIPSGVSTR